MIKKPRLFKAFVVYFAGLSPIHRLLGVAHAFDLVGDSPVCLPFSTHHASLALYSPTSFDVRSR